MSGFTFNASNPFGGFGGANTGGTGAGTGTTGTGFSLGTPASGGMSLFGNTSSTPASNLAGTSGSTTSNPPTSLFGQPTSGGTSSTPTAATPAAPPGGLFGFGKPADPNAAKPSVFGAPASSTPSGTGAPSTSLFGNLPKPAEGAASGTATPASGGGLFGGAGLFGKKPETPQPVGTTPTSTTAPAAGSATTTFSLGTNKDASASTGFSLSGNQDASKDITSTGSLFGVGSANKTDSTFTATGATPSLFGAKDSSSNTSSLLGSKDSSNTTTTPTLFGAKDTAKSDASSTNLLGLKPPAAGTQPATSTTTAATASKDGNKSTAISVPPPSVLRGKSVEEIVGKWSADLDNHVKEFNKFAGEVAVWDRALMENGNNLATLSNHVLNVEREQTDIEQSLDHVEQQQKDLLATLSAYEGSINEILGGQGGSLRALDTGPADTERDKNFMLATELHGHLDDLSSSLTQMIESVNALSIGSGSTNALPGSQTSPDDPMTQISQILSNHLESLQWIDGAVREVEGKVNEVERRIGDVGGVNGVGGSQTKSRGAGLSR